MKLNEQKLQELLNNINNFMESYLSEAKQITTVEDFFDFLATNPKLGTSAFVYYTNPVKINKNLEGRGKNAIKNPMYSEELGHSIIFKSSWYSFNFGQLYADKMKQIDPNWQPTSRETSIVNHPDMKYVSSGPNGDYIDILPLGFGTPTYAIYDINVGAEGLHDVNNYQIINKDSIKQYLPPEKEFGGIQIRKLFITRIYELAAGNHLFKSPEFKFAYFGEKAKSRQ
jgi:hypothetical protein